MKVCGARTNSQAITWGSPLVIIKSNDFKFDIYDIQINEIIPSPIIKVKFINLFQVSIINLILPNTIYFLLIDFKI